tara:strand:+ start:11563 stop:12573 length:1011 start_codon:yes stop_codon:yes gene_type:complete
VNFYTLNRDQQRQAFARKHGWGNVHWQALTSDASFRQYYRLTGEDRSVLLMDAAAPYEDIGAYLDMTGHLRKHGFSVPEIFAEDRATGFALIEDFGDATFTRLFTEGRDEESLYLLATDVLVALHQNQRVLDADLPLYDLARMKEEISLFVDWYVPAALGRSATEKERRAFDMAWREVLERVADRPETLVLRDYHVDNLMLLKGRPGVRACGLLDYQDALAGPRAYDLVSLLEDARKDVSADLKARVLHRYAQGCGALSEIFLTDMVILGAQRHTKVAGIFVRLYVRDGKAAYLRHLPRVMKLLETSLNHSALAEVKSVMETMVPDFGRVALPYLP